MVAVDAQILAGVAVTVLLALLFFGVVVLWDVALALRGVADTVDKLEDTLDDDLTDLERAVDGSPGGGGAQVHLSGGGTISPGTTGPQSPPGQPGPAAGGGVAADARNARGRTRANGQAHAEDAQHGTTESQAAAASPDGAEADGATGNPDAETGGAADDGSPERPPQSRESIGADPTPVRDAPAEDSEGPARDEDETESERDESEADQEHPRASVNQGRFITSPDRTAWYRTPLDREAIAEARSPIVGELEAGRPPSDREADEDAATVETQAPADEEPIVVGPGGPDETVSGTGSPDGEANRSANEGASIDTESGADQVSTDADDADASGTIESDPDDDADAETKPDTPESDAEPGVDDQPDADFDDPRREVPDDEGSDPQSTADGESSDEEDVGESQLAVSDADGDAIETDGQPADLPPSEDDSADAPSVNDAADAPSDDGEGHEVSETEPGAPATDPPAEEADAGRSDDGAVPDDPVAQSHAETDDEFEPDEGMEFTFEEVTPSDDPEPELTVDDAVDAVNDETPALSRSAHGVESRAEVDDDGVVLVYDLEDSEASGSTTRLLRYQLQSFAAESDADVDVTVSGNRVVVEIPGAEGSDVSQWRTAIVEVIDRTLYLSDNSE